MCRAIILILIFGKMKGQCPPQLSYEIPNDSLTCYSPTMIAIGTTTSANTVLNWESPFVPPVIYSHSVLIDPTLFGTKPGTPDPDCFTYTLVATNTLLSCSSTSLLTLCKNFKQPYVKPAIIGTNSIICQNNELLLGIGNSTALSGIPGATLINPFWEGPDGTGTGLNFTAATPGVYSLTMRDSYNGCMKTGTVLVGGSIPAFGLQGTAPTSSNSCNGSIYVAHPNITGYTISATSGSVNGDNISNLCYGWVKVCMTFTNSGCYKCDSLLMNGATSIAENEMNDRFEVYPNPSTGNVNVKFPGVVEGVISLMDMKGKEVQSVVSTGSTTLLEIKDLSPGIYFIELTTEKRTFRKKLVILEP